MVFNIVGYNVDIKKIKEREENNMSAILDFLSGVVFVVGSIGIVAGCVIAFINATIDCGQ